MKFPTNFLERRKEGRDFIAEEARLMTRTESGQMALHDDEYKGWGEYGNGAEGYFSKRDIYQKVSFAGLDTLENIRAQIKRLKEKGPVLGLDIMGQGLAGIELGCDKVFAFTLPSMASVHDNDGNEGIDLVRGDIYEPKDQQSLMVRLEEQLESGGKLGLVTFRPYGGIKMFKNKKDDNDFMTAYASLRGLFKQVYSKVTPGGLIFIELDALPEDVFKAFLDMMDKMGISYIQKEFDGKKYQVLKIIK